MSAASRLAALDTPADLSENDRMWQRSAIPIIDIFAGPGGLGEGFSSFTNGRGKQPFTIALSIEKDPIAHQTLKLRSFFRQFPPGEAPDAYYQRLERRISTAELFDLFPQQSTAADEEAWHATLGDDREAPLSELRRRVRGALNRFPGGEDRWVLIGGPPCQAYSLIGRASNRRDGYNPEEDRRHHLHQEYVKIIVDRWPVAFVIENVQRRGVA